jgi:uncharacterized protein with von Willebrand factor type A (vWA) domain
VTHLLPNLLRFGRLLHAAGLEAPPGRMVEVAQALTHIDISRRADFYFTLQSLLVSRPQDRALFAEAFRLFWREPLGPGAQGRRRVVRTGTPRVESLAGEIAGDAAGVPALEASASRTSAQSYSDREVSRTADFATFTEEELQQARQVLATLRWNVDERRTRRWRQGKGRALDFRRIVRRNLRYGAEPIVVPTKRRKVEVRPLVLLCDVSGSMERYARMLLYFVHGLASRRRVEAFVFATRLTRITRDLVRAQAADVVPAIPGRLPDWGGGTRIGEALRAFNVRWARRVSGRGPVVLLISDGWDRGEPDLLRREMRRLQRTCHRLIWLNPLLGSPEYQPLTRGMQAALPFVDDFLPVHNLTSLDALASHLNALPARRGTRHPRPRHERT